MGEFDFDLDFDFGGQDIPSYNFDISDASTGDGSFNFDTSSYLDSLERGMEGGNSFEDIGRSLSSPTPTPSAPRTLDPSIAGGVEPADPSAEPYNPDPLIAGPSAGGDSASGIMGTLATLAGGAEKIAGWLEKNPTLGKLLLGGGMSLLSMLTKPGAVGGGNAPNISGNASLGGGKPNIAMGGGGSGKPGVGADQFGRQIVKGKYGPIMKYAAEGGPIGIESLDPDARLNSILAQIESDKGIY